MSNAQPNDRWIEVNELIEIKLIIVMMNFYRRHC